MSQTDEDRPSTPSLIGDAIKQATSLFSAEISLVKLEASEKLAQALTAVLGIVVAAVAMMVALLFLLAGIVFLLVSLLHWAVFVACFAVGGVILFIAIVAVALAARSLTAAQLKPSRTIREAKNTAELAKGVIS